MDMKLKQINSAEDMPRKAHFAIIVFDSQNVWIPGDERSRSAPGHGYPERTETFESFKYYATTSKREWEEFAKELYSTDKRGKFVAFEVGHVATIDVSVTISVK